MAMSNCKECGKAVSTKAKTCPNCGVPKPTLQKKKKITKATSRKLVWAHCSNKKCRDYTEMYQIKTVEFWYETCNLCKKNFKKAEIRDGRPVMPSDGTYESRTTTHSMSQSDKKVSSSTQTTSGEKDTVSKFSDGELDLATSFWGFLFAGGLVVGFVCGFLSGAYGKGWYIPLIGYTIFVIQGTWQSAEKYKIEQKKKKQSEVWGFLAQVVCVMNGISIIGMIAEFF